MIQKDVKKCYVLCLFCTVCVKCFFLLSDNLSKQRLWSLWKSAHPSQNLPSNPASQSPQTPPDQSETDKGEPDEKAHSDDEKEMKTEEATENQLKEHKDDQSPEVTESGQAPESPVINGYRDEEQDVVPVSSEDLFKMEPFVVAAAQFRRGMYAGVLDLLTEALSTGGKVEWTLPSGPRVAKRHCG